MFSTVHNHVLQKINEANIIEYPYPHIIIDNFFPTSFYDHLIQNPIPKEYLNLLSNSKRVLKTYSSARNVLNLNTHLPMLPNHLRYLYQDLTKWFNFYLKNILFNKFNLRIPNIEVDVLYTRDSNSYSLGPHTDRKSKVLTSLIYLPEDESLSQFGTSIYIPKDPLFTCKGGPHYDRENFNLYKTIPFIPNKMFCFLKTDVSFHGVEPINKDIDRNLLIFDLQKK